MLPTLGGGSDASALRARGAGVGSAEGALAADPLDVDPAPNVEGPVSRSS